MTDNYTRDPAYKIAAECLAKGAEISKQRAEEHGGVTVEWTMTAAIWSILVGKEIKPWEAMGMMEANKLVRIKLAPREDHFDDDANYAALAKGVWKGTLKMPTEPDERKWAWTYNEQTEPRDPPPFLKQPPHSREYAWQPTLPKKFVEDLTAVAAYTPSQPSALPADEYPKQAVVRDRPVTQMAPDTPVSPKAETRSMLDTSRAAKATQDPETATYSSGGETGAAHRQIFTGQECA